MFSAKNRSTKPGVVSFDFVKEDRRVGMYYFYVYDADFGPGFIKICTYFPYPAKVWLNGHEWAKRQARRENLGFTELANGFSSCEDPARLQAICDRFGPDDIEAFFARWTAVIPTPFTDGRPRRRLLLGAVDAPSRGLAARSCSTTPAGPGGSSRPSSRTTSASAVPSRSAAVFVPTRRGARTQRPSRTRVFSPGTDVQIDFSYKHSRVKQYLKEGRALRIETVINKPSDIGVLARLEHLPELVAKARQVNDRLLMIERAGQGCAIGSALFERIHQPYIREGQRTGAFRFGDQRAMALAGALCLVVHAVTGFTNKSLRGQVAGLLGNGLQPFADELRPPPPPPPRSDRASSPAPTPTRSPPKASESPSSTPSSTPDSSARSSTPTHRPRPIELRRALATIDRAPHRLRHQRPTRNRSLKLVTKSRNR